MTPGTCRFQTICTGWGVQACLLKSRTISLVFWTFSCSWFTLHQSTKSSTGRLLSLSSSPLMWTKISVSSENVRSQCFSRNRKYTAWREEETALYPEVPLHCSWAYWRHIPPCGHIAACWGSPWSRTPKVVGQPSWWASPPAGEDVLC